MVCCNEIMPFEYVCKFCSNRFGWSVVKLVSFPEAPGEKWYYFFLSVGQTLYWPEKELE